MVTGSLQIKGRVYYIVLNLYIDNKRVQRWIPTTIIADGKKINQVKAEKILSDIRLIYNKDSYIDNKKTAEQLLKEQNKINQLSLSNESNNDNKTEILNLNNTPLSSEEELIITKCLSAWYNTSKEEMINSLMNVITLNIFFSEGLKPNTVKHHRSILSCVFTRAVEQELFEYNFINNLKPIKSDQYIGNFYKHDELLYLFEVVKETTIRLEVILAAVYGLRREEVLGLKWDAIDFTRKTITIKHTKDIQIWLGHSNIQTTMIYTHMDETNKEISAQVLIAKFQYILNNYNENEIYEMEDETLNNIYENMDNSNQFQGMKKVVATVQN